MRLMKTNNSSGNKSSSKGNIILGKLVTKNINKIARSTKFIKRKRCKIFPKTLKIGFMKMVSKQRNTFTDWATEIGFLENKTISKQAIHERMNEATQELITKVVEEFISKESTKLNTKRVRGVLKYFKNVKIDDSTTIHLPEELVEEFPGNVSRGERKAQAKVHAMYNLTNNEFDFLNVHSFSNNDQSLSGAVLPYLKKGDLCLRDLGFLVFDVVEQFIKNGIYFISRKKYQSKLYDVESGKELDLLKSIRKRGVLDRLVLLGKEHQLPVRLIAIPLPVEVVNARIRKAKKDRDKRLNHSKEYYQLLGYGIYITNVTREQCTAIDIYEIYKLRWNIEIIFKSWKTCFSIEKLIHKGCKNSIRVKCMIYLMLLYIFLFQTIWLRYCEQELCLNKVRQISILKMAHFYRKYFSDLITQTNNEKILMQLRTHCLYDTRKDRDNAKLVQIKMAA